MEDLEGLVKEYRFSYVGVGGEGTTPQSHAEWGHIQRDLTLISHLRLPFAFFEGIALLFSHLEHSVLLQTRRVLNIAVVELTSLFFFF